MASDIIDLRVKGQDIINAVKRMADKPVFEQDLVDGKNVFILGQKSDFPYKDLIITVGDEKTIDPDKIYGQLRISEYRWDGSKYLIGYEQEDVIDAVKKFTDAMRHELEKNIQALEPDKMPISFEFEGAKYECPRTAYDKHNIVLPDGRVLTPTRWLERHPPIPDGLYVIETIPMAIKVK